MDERGAHLARARRVMLSGALGLMVVGAAPWPVSAADESAAPVTGADESAVPTATPSPDPSATPSPAPTEEPSPAPTPDPTITTAEGSTDPSPSAGQTVAPATQSPPPAPTPTPNPSPSPTPSTPPSPTATIAALNLYRSSAMTRQYTNYWCVPAATQSMLNLVRGTSNRLYSSQSVYYRYTRRHNRYTYATRGNDPQGWAWALRYFSKYTANYQARSFTDKTAAVNAIAEAIQRTRHPVGVTVYAGTHAWVVLGYRYSVNLADPSKRTLLGLYVSGPLGTSADRWPYKYLTVSQFRTYFTRYHEWQKPVIWEGKWVVISE